jgi:hypothetical protein
MFYHPPHKKKGFIFVWEELFLFVWVWFGLVFIGVSECEQDRKFWQLS